MNVNELHVLVSLWISLADARVGWPKETVGDGRKAPLKGVWRTGLGFASGKVCMLACETAMGLVRWLPLHAY